MPEVEKSAVEAQSSEPNKKGEPEYDPVTAKQVKEHEDAMRFHLDALRDLKKEHAVAVQNRQPKARPNTGIGPKAPVQACPHEPKQQPGSSKTVKHPPVKSKPQRVVLLCLLWGSVLFQFWCLFAFEGKACNSKSCSPES